MSVVDHHAPGDFCWIELATSNQDAAKSFYTALFGWTVQDVPMGPGGIYSLLQLNGRIAASAYTMLPEESSTGLPPHWKLYVAVTNADESVRKAGELGAKIIDPPFDIGDRGRTAVIQDPTGAVFFLWQPGKRSGVGVTGEPGSFCWADLTTPDQARAKSFYEGLFGWNVIPGRDNSGYLHVVNGHNYIGGIPPARPGSNRTPPHWLVYFAVADVDKTFQTGKELNARILMPPMEFQGVGRMAILADPQGAVFALFKQANR